MDAQDECTSVCSSKQHGDELSSVIMTPTLTDQEVLSYCTFKCRNYGRLINTAGQGLCHVAAATGRLALLRHLLHLRDCLNETDSESNFTLLHACVWHGEVHCAVRLMQLGCRRELQDNEYLTPLDFAMKDRAFLKLTPDDFHQELYVWGSNTNYNLGCGHDRERTLPEPHDFFQKAKIPIKQVILEKFHSVFIAVNGTAWACGLGGRAGIAMDNAAVEPRRIPFSPNTQVISCSAGEQHTIFLTSAGMAFSCGINTHAVLGHSQRPAALPTPKAVRGLPTLTGVAASHFHSVFYNEKQLFTCGTNHGQLGHPATESEVVTPKEVTMIQMKGTTIIHVAASTGATVVLNSEGAVYLLAAHRCTRLTPRDWLRKGSKVCVKGGPPTGDPATDIELKVAILTFDNQLIVWRDATKMLLPCTFTARRQLKIFDVALTNTGCIFTTNDGEAFLGFFRDGKKNKMFECIESRRLAHIHRGETCSADARGRNFAVLQNNPRLSTAQMTMLGVEQLQETSTVYQDLAILLDECSEDDIIHDIVFKVSGRCFPAHKFIVFYGNESLSMKKLLSENKEAEANSGSDDISTIVLSDLPVDGFRTVLRFVYTTRVFLKSSVENSQEIDISTEGHRRKDVDIKHLTETRLVARRLGVPTLLHLLEGKPWTCNNGLNRKCLPASFDVSLVSQDGTLVHAHRCVLVARLEFFRVMLTHGWRETSAIKLKVPVPGRVLEVLVDYLYTGKAHEIEESTDVDFLSLVLMSADELLCEGLKQCTAEALQRLLSLRNAADLLQLAATFNAFRLVSCAQIFILTNLAYFLESRSLEVLPDIRLEELSKLYKVWLPARRRMRSSLDDVGVVMVRSLAEAFPTVLTCDMDAIKISVAKQTAKKKRERKTSERNRHSESCDEIKVTPIRGSELPPVTSPVTSSLTSTVTSPGTPHVTSSNPTCTPTKEQSVINSPQPDGSPLTPVQRRLKVIVEAANIVPCQETFTSLTKKTAEISLVHFPELQSQRTEKILHSPQPKVQSPTNSEASKRFTKLSQRERRRLASVSSNDGESPSPVKCTATVSPWAIIPPPVTSTSPANTNKVSEMSAIIDAERADRERSARMRSKPLLLTQLEDRALRELEVFYNVAAATDEHITVSRLTTPAATAPPVWPVSRPR